MVKPWHRVAAEAPKAAEARKSSQASNIAGTTKSNGQKSLIPEKWVAIPTQRLFAVAIFVGLQAVKISGAIEPSIARAIGFSILDALYLWILPYFAIPWLTFRPLATAFAFSVMVSINTLLFIDPIWLTVVTSTIIKFFTGTELSIMGTRVRKDALGSHSLGSYVVNYLPELSATLSADEQLCTTDSGGEVYLHLSLNATWPESLSLRVTPLTENAESTTLNFTKRELARMPKRGSTDLWIPVETPGAYQLLRLQDAKSGSPVLVSTAMNAIVVPPCPKSWLEVDTSPACQGQKLTAQVYAEGIGPFKVHLKNGQTLDLPQGSAKYAVSRQQASIALVATPGLEIGLASVQDALGNQVKLNEKTKFTVYRPSSAKLRNERLALLDSAVHAEITVDGEDGPFDIAYSKDGGEPSVITLQRGKHKVVLESPGTFSLVDLHGQLCQGSVSGSVEVFSPPPVELKVAFQQIEDPCAGPSGIDADITLSGTPPFRVWYRALSGGRVLFDKELRVNGYTDKVKFKPHNIGTFDYEFTAVADGYRRVTLQGDEYTQQQTISELAGAALMPMRTRYCPGEEVKAAVKLQGRAPLTLEYSVDDKTHVLEGLEQSVTLPLGELSGGVHVVRINSITDGRGCKTALDVRSPDIHVRTERSSVKFAQPGIRKVTNPKQDLALQVQGGPAPYHLEYTVNGAARSVDLTRPELLVSEVGTFKLVSFRDAECQGSVDSDETITIELIPRPALGLGESQPATTSLCLGSVTAVTLQATGMPPFTVHDHLKASTVFSESEFTLNVAPAATVGPTTLYYWMNDANYDDATKPVQVVLDIPPAPAAQFKSPDHEYKVCQGSLSPPAIPITLSGKGPFEVYVDVENVATGKKFRTLVSDPDTTTSGSKTFALTSVYEDIMPGQWKLSIHSVSDGTLCGKRPGSGKPVYISMSRAPSLGSIDKEAHICVGDYVDLTMHGHGPFELEYSFEDRQIVALTESKFRRLSSYPGVITFDKIRDAAGCESGLSNSVTVHDLPTSKITHQPQFSIHHGETVDLAFEFTGVPPFTFTYTRSVRGKEVDRRTVSDVKDHSYSIYTQEEGTYEVVELRDRYCRVGI